MNHPPELGQARLSSGRPTCDRKLIMRDLSLRGVRPPRKARGRLAAISTTIPEVSHQECFAEFTLERPERFFAEPALERRNRFFAESTREPELRSFASLRMTVGEGLRMTQAKGSE